ncbi:MAG: 2-oxoglutarate dehydrogenase E1 component, partial [Candidatus Eisenbacteria bacterium]|nr:2-oxoglutarate dehydrogenase E1 component [Candidatus Eisenbacteria bacterium]
MTTTPTRLDFVQQANAAYIEALYERYRRDPASVPEEWALFFAGFDLAGQRGAPAAGAGGIAELIRRWRADGHRAAHLDPLGDPPPLLPSLDPGDLGFGEADLAAPADPRPFLAARFTGTLGDLIALLRETYGGTLGAECMVEDAGRREWLLERMERSRNRPDLEPADRVRILRQLRAADAFEEFLHVKYVGQKRFSLEGAATLVPMLDALIERAGALGVEQIALGMPHRGRLNVLANVMMKPLEVIFGEFEEGHAPGEAYGHGDVKYHRGYQACHATRAGRSVH